MAHLIKADGTIQEVKPANGKFFTLKELQGFVGGYIEVNRNLRQGEYQVVNAVAFLEQPLNGDIGTLLTVAEDSLFVLNEEGKLRDLPLNPIATEMYLYKDHDTICGDVLLATGQGPEIV